MEECDEVRYLLKAEQGFNAKLKKEIAQLKHQRWWFGFGGALMVIVIILLL